MKKITRYFFEGLIVLLPLSATIYFLYWIFITVDGLFNFEIPGIGFLITIGIIFLSGIIASSILTRGFVGLIHDLFGKLPLIKIIYSSIKDLIEAFVGDKKKFNKPVLVQASEWSGIELLGFVTEENLHLLGETEKVAVYIPQAYNFAGNLILVPKSNVKYIDAKAQEVMTFIVSGGLSSSEK